MNISRNYFIHETALFYLFILGGSLFTFGKCGIFCVLIAALLGFLTLYVFYKLKKTKNRIFLFFSSAICIFNGIYTFGKFVLFIKEKQLFYTSVILIYAVFAAVVIYFCHAGKKTILKFSLLAFTISILFWCLLFFATVKNADFTDIKYSLDFDFSESLKVYLSLFFPAFIPIIWIKPKSFKPLAFGLIISSVIFLVFIILTYCTFGKLNVHLDSPILSLVDAANVGRVFTRLDAFLLAIIYLSCLIRCGISFKTAHFIFAIFENKNTSSELTKNSA